MTKIYKKDLNKIEFFEQNKTEDNQTIDNDDSNINYNENIGENAVIKNTWFTRLNRLKSKSTNKTNNKSTNNNTTGQTEENWFTHKFRDESPKKWINKKPFK